ncbi:MAG: PAS domain-containing protein [Rhodocyclaceae bacterium]|nr:PAS domain-containing protein [Rhodocyclaceae bacterium]MDZ4213247.1 PAS domain-containing protein [Rhodocyclaceae bacterium]
MTFSFRHWPLKTRITVFTLTIFVLSIWSLSFYASRMLERDLQNLMGEQQFSAASLTAEGLNEQFADRFEYLDTVADQAIPFMFREGAVLQAFIESKQILKLMFNAGAFITDTDGKAIASFPRSLDRTSTSYMDRDYIIAALKEGKATVGQPTIGRKLGGPVFVMATPIKDSQGKIIGALAGVIDLSQPNFLDKVTNSHYGASGGYFILHPKLRLIVSATDKRRNMQPLVARGAIPTLDRFLDGYEGSAKYVTPFGIEVLGSTSKIPAAGWLLGIATPITESFAPIREMQQRIYLAALLLTLMAAGLTWWMLRRQLSPMLAAVQTMSTLAAGDQPPQALPITRNDEIGTLIAGFNRMLETLAQRAAALKVSDGRATTLIETSPLPLVLNDEYGNIIYVNQAFIKTIGYELNEIPTLEHWWPLAYPDPKYRKWVAERWQEYIEQAKRTNQPFVPFEINIVCKDGLMRTFMASASAYEQGLSKTHLVILFDITEKKQAELALIATTNRLNEAQLMAKVGNWTLNLPGGELIWSDEIFRIFEIDPDKFAATYEAFLNAIHPDDRDAVSQAYAKSLETRSPYEIIHRLRMSDGRIKWVVEKCMSDFDAAGRPLQSRGMVQDITERKCAEDQLFAMTEHLEEQVSIRTRQLRDISAQLTMTEERERFLLAQDLHDNLGQLLALIKIKLSVLGADLPPTAVEDILKLVDQSDQAVRMITQRLSPPILRMLDFKSALESLAEEMQCLHGLAVRIHVNTCPKPQLNDIQAILFRSARELLFNVAKHARVGVATLAVHCNDEELRLIVSDNGCGFTAGRIDGSLPGHGSFGLSSIHGHMSTIGGQMEIDSRLGHGTTITLTLPCFIATKEVQPS